MMRTKPQAQNENGICAFRSDVVRHSVAALGLLAAVGATQALQAQSAPRSIADGNVDLALNRIVVADTGSLKTRNIQFGRGTRSLQDTPASIPLSLPALSAYSTGLFGASDRRIDSVFKRRISAELDFYGLVGNNGHDEEFRYDAEDWSASVVLRIPVTILNLYGKFGAIHQNSGYRGLVNTSSLDGGDTDGFHRWSRTDGFASIGAELSLGFFNLFGEYMRIDSEDESEVDTFSTGIKFRF